MPDKVAAEIERQESVDTFSEDIEALDRRLTGIGNQRSRLARAVAMLDDDETATPLLSELHTLAKEANTLAAERAHLSALSADRAAGKQRLEDLMRWCGRVAEKLPTLTYDQKRLALEALGVTVKVYRMDHRPRWEMTMLPMPFDSIENDPFVFSSPMASTTVIARWIRNRSMG